ncbi:hypothetical protein O3G_MSEX004378 [Manduca sexta]|uniref:RNase H type-1 domain-containing protein n=1 Tax=Manduca sexta TaxID=7130 RepID=A0A922CHF1_MANSE|nr:hypothetical protein O3G_MSEX004378 [Manduca sexta]
MDEPLDPGGDVPQPSHFITIETASSLDTDCSVSNTNKRKRIRLSKVCKICNKKKRKNAMAVDSGRTECRCEDSDEKITENQSPLKAPHTQALPSQASQVPPNITDSIRKEYTALDASPFIIHVARSSTGEITQDLNLHPICFGRFLYKNQVSNIVQGSLKRIGRNKISMAFTSHLAANSFLKHHALLEKGYEAFIPSFNVTRMGLVRGIPVDMSVEEIKENIRVPLGCGDIITFKYHKTVIFSDSYSALQAVEKFPFKSKCHSIVIINIRQKLVECLSKNIIVVLCWVPGHANIKGNVKADRLANEAITSGDIYPYINYCNDLTSKYFSQGLLEKVLGRKQSDKGKNIFESPIGYTGETMVLQIEAW